MIIRILVAVMFFLGCCLLARSLLNLIPAIKAKRDSGKHKDSEKRPPY